MTGRSGTRSSRLPKRLKPREEHRQTHVSAGSTDPPLGIRRLSGQSCRAVTVGDTLLNPYCLALCLRITVQILLRILRWRMIPSEPNATRQAIVC
ncbi:MAG: hypothetical protein R3B91_14360 [Planctomycetaceae bacterium]